MNPVSFVSVIDRVVDKKLPFRVPDCPQDVRSVSEGIAYLLSTSHDSAPTTKDILTQLRRNLPNVLHSAFAREDPIALLDAHKALFAIYEVSFVNPLSPAASYEYSTWLIDFRSQIEKAWLDYELPRIEDELPSDGDLAAPGRLAAWFTSQASHETSIDQRVVRFLAEEANLDHFKFFVLSDAHLNYRFYDALVLAQLFYSETVKAEISRHMWDESGCGDFRRAHTLQFSRALQTLNLSDTAIPIWDDWRPYAGYNLYLCFGLSRRHYFKAIGSLAMPELFDPDRDRAVITGLNRLNFNAKEQFEYYYSHIEGDEDHGPAWIEKIVIPIVKAQPESARELAIGGAIRMEYMRHFNLYLSEKFGIA